MDRKSPIPAYHQLATEIQHKIDSGTWLPGYCIPGERILAEEYTLSRMTVRQALDQLVQKGLLVREKGKGTFVCEKNIKQRNIMSFTEIMNRLGTSFTTQITCFEKIQAHQYSTLPFDNEQLYKIKRLRIVKNTVIGEETLYIPCRILPDLKLSDLQSSFYKYLDEKGLSVYESDASIQAVSMNALCYEVFRVNEALPLLQVTSKNYSESGELIFVEESVYRSDKYMLQVNIVRKEGYLK